ncbi:unnamed protein product [Tilletia controversa]|nr:unnamed protein product [Tilletia controversa]
MSEAPENQEKLMSRRELLPPSSLVAENFVFFEQDEQLLKLRMRYAERAPQVIVVPSQVFFAAGVGIASALLVWGALATQIAVALDDA